MPAGARSAWDASHAGRCAPGAHDEDRGRLASANISAFRLSGVERSEEPVDEVAFGRLVRRSHGVPDRVPEHHVRLRREGGARVVTRRGQTVVAGVRRDAARRIDHRHLSAIGLRIGRRQGRQRVRGILASSHQVESERAVRPLGKRLSRDDADTGFAPRHHRADREPVRLHGNAHLAAFRIARDDGVRHRRRGPDIWRTNTMSVRDRMTSFASPDAGERSRFRAT